MFKKLYFKVVAYVYFDIKLCTLDKEIYTYVKAVSFLNKIKPACEIRYII
jgi:hypothetical protein